MVADDREWPIEDADLRWRRLWLVWTQDIYICMYKAKCRGAHVGQDRTFYDGDFTVACVTATRRAMLFSHTHTPAQDNISLKLSYYYIFKSTVINRPDNACGWLRYLQRIFIHAYTNNYIRIFIMSLYYGAFMQQHLINLLLVIMKTSILDLAPR